MKAERNSKSRVIEQFLQDWQENGGEQVLELLRGAGTELSAERGSRADERYRAFLALDWLCRVCAPTWLRAAGLHSEAVAIEKCAEIVNAATARAALTFLSKARDNANFEMTNAAIAREKRGGEAETWQDEGNEIWMTVLKAGGGGAAWLAASNVDGEGSKWARDAAWNGIWYSATLIALRSVSTIEADKVVQASVEELQASALTLLKQMTVRREKSSPLPAAEHLLSAPKIEFEDLLKALNETRVWKDKRGLQAFKQVRILAATWNEFSANDEEKLILRDLL